MSIENLEIKAEIKEEYEKIDLSIIRTELITPSILLAIKCSNHTTNYVDFVCIDSDCTNLCKYMCIKCLKTVHFHCKNNKMFQNYQDYAYNKYNNLNAVYDNISHKLNILNNFNRITKNRMKIKRKLNHKKLFNDIKRDQKFKQNQFYEEFMSYKFNSIEQKKKIIDDFNENQKKFLKVKNMIETHSSITSQSLNILLKIYNSKDNIFLNLFNENKEILKKLKDLNSQSKYNNNINRFRGMICKKTLKTLKKALNKLNNNF